MPHPLLSRACWIACLILVNSSPAMAIQVTELSQSDFTYGTYIIDKPGYYKLTEDINFNPNSVTSLQAAIDQGIIPAHRLQALGLPETVDAFSAAMPLPSQYSSRADQPFTPGGPMQPRYDPAAFGIGFFAAIAITSHNVVLDLNGHTIAQSPEHALLQRFFSVIELAGQPFIPGQGPADFGAQIQAAQNVVIRNGTIGRSAHHGIHGNANRHISVVNVDFEDYEVGAVALNGVQGLIVRNVRASNRKDVPVLGTFSAAQFIKPYLAELIRNASDITLTVAGRTLDATQLQTRLRQAVNSVYHDVIEHAGISGQPARIDPNSHPLEYALFHNRHGVVDGNSYSFLVNRLGAAVDGFPLRGEDPAEHLLFSNIKVQDQHAFINEVVALTSPAGGAMTDPVGAVWQLFNRHPVDETLLTISSPDPSRAHYVGNPLADAQALVAKAIARGDFADSSLDVSRSSISSEALAWVEARPGYETLERIAPSDNSFRCNGDSMFHVNKGVIAFKMDAASQVLLRNTLVHGLINLGRTGSDVCGDYGSGKSHPAATLNGYGGAAVRGYSFAGSAGIHVHDAAAVGLHAKSGHAIGFDVLTDSARVHFKRPLTRNINAGLGGVDRYDGANPVPTAAGIRIGPQTERVSIIDHCVSDLNGYGGTYEVDDQSQTARLSGDCRG